MKNSCLFPLKRTKRKLNVQSSINLLSSYSLSDLKIKILWKPLHRKYECRFDGSFDKQNVKKE